MASLGWPAEAGPAQPAVPGEGAGADAGPSPATPTLGPQGWPQQALSSCGRPSMQPGKGAGAGRSPATPTLGLQGWPQHPLSSGGRSGMQRSWLVCVRWFVPEAKCVPQYLLHCCGSTLALKRITVCSVPPSHKKARTCPGDQGSDKYALCIAGAQAAPPSPMLCTPANAGIAAACASPAAFGSAITCAAPSPAERLEPRVATPAMLQIPDRCDGGKAAFCVP